MTDTELIAEFMGITVRPIGKVFYIAEEDGYVDLTEASVYWPERDWNQLMAVVENIFVVAPMDVKEINNEGLDIFELGLTAKINEIYQAVIEFIKWYNENKTK